MGVRISIGSYTFQASSYLVREDATPLAAGDSFGSTGTIEFVVPQPDYDLPGSQLTAWKRLTTVGPEFFIDMDVRLADSRKGFTLGTVNGIRANDDGTFTFSCVSRLDKLNVYGVQAQPFIGTLDDAFEYYLSLANVTTDLFVDDSVASREVVLPGWNGELWYHLKQFAVAQDLDLSLVSGVILLRPIRAREATRGRDISRARDISAGTLAQFVEVYQYNNEEITNELVYPPGGWTNDVQVLNVNAGETEEYTLELSASVSSIQTPSFETSVAPEYGATSVYTVVANDGLPISEAAWDDYGGSLTITINPDTVTLNVKIVGPLGLPTSTGEEATQFSIALGSDTTGNRYSTLRIVGTGVRYNKVKHRVRTCVPPERAATEVGVTIDNPFISTVQDRYRAGVRAARKYAGYVPGLSGRVTAINRRGDTGVAVYPKYSEVQTALETALGTPTYADVETYYTVTNSLSTYRAVRDFWFSTVQDDYTNQVFGNVNGARVFDKKSRRWYRIRSATVTADGIDFQADDDLTHSDIETFHAAASRTYGDVQLVMDGLTYKQVGLVGMYGG